MFIKPIAKTLLLSSIGFVLLVILGIKYHWVELFNLHEDKVELTLPQSSIPLTTAKENNKERNSSFQLEIIQTEKQPITANMTKQQILEGCLQLYNKLGFNNESMTDVIIGGCVVSNYQETIQTTSIQQSGNEQAQRNLLIKKRCYQQLESETRLTPLEKQLLWGVCVSNGLNR